MLQLAILKWVLLHCSDSAMAKMFDANCSLSLVAHGVISKNEGARFSAPFCPCCAMFSAHVVHKQDAVWPYCSCLESSWLWEVPHRPRTGAASSYVTLPLGAGAGSRQGHVKGGEVAAVCSTLAILSRWIIP